MFTLGSDGNTRIPPGPVSIQDKAREVLNLTVACGCVVVVAVMTIGAANDSITANSVFPASYQYIPSAAVLPTKGSLAPYWVLKWTHR